MIPAISILVCHRRDRRRSASLGIDNTKRLTLIEHAKGSRFSGSAMIVIAAALLTERFFG